ncbi:HNH endonuclease [Burkholderia vietnamiensis]|uniref:HNH endonuclease n=1 Tax=Burkholderia vietnamiensis TaxID=60552 RepID=UPI00264D023E|nr:HNH endonuclease [Burkholderia vietnamiensis]MDN7552884.1 HNH endonuclease [Burkholderia vietnamiensis]HDR9093071.1 HNH endonuclease [Burkholderia vietnamiensis]
MNIWRLIAHHEDPVAAVEEMKARNRIAVGWSLVKDLSRLAIARPSDISDLIRSSYPNLQNAHLGGPSLWNLFHKMQIGDLVILSARGARNSVFEVIGPYTYEHDAGQILGYAHQRAACLTSIDPDTLWSKSGTSVAEGQNVRWTLAACIKSPEAESAIYREGARFSVTSTAFERNPWARQKCIAHYGCKCFVCKFDFEKVYGELGAGFIHVHHRIELSSRNGEYVVDPIEDLVPLCPNCHAMAHQRRPAIPIEDLLAIIRT